MKFITILLVSLFASGGAFADIKKADPGKKKVETSKPIQPKKLQPGRLEPSKKK